MTTPTIAAERIISLSGELDMARRDEVRALLAAYDDGQPLVVDLAGADFVDLQTVALLVRRQGPTELRGASPLVDRVVRIITSV